MAAEGPQTATLGQRDGAADHPASGGVAMHRHLHLLTHTHWECQHLSNTLFSHRSMIYWKLEGSWGGGGLLGVEGEEK